MALLGAVYGGVNVLVKFTPGDAANASTGSRAAEQMAAVNDPPVPTVPGLPQAGPAPDAEAALADAPGDAFDSNPGASNPPSPETLQRLARMIRFEIVDPTRALPLLEPTDVQRVHAFATVLQLDRAKPVAQPRGQKWWLTPFSKSIPAIDPQRVTRIELVTNTQWQTYDDDLLIASGPNTLGRVPLVHVQNTADPMAYEGASDVEQLIPLQDELNTRLSDRAYRIAMTSFKMYLGNAQYYPVEFRGVAPSP